MTSREWSAFYGLSRTHPKLVEEMLDKMVADMDKPCRSPLLDMCTQPTPDGEGFSVTITYPAKPRRARWDR